MATCLPADYESIYNELLKHYLGPEYYPIPKSAEKTLTAQVKATTLDEYLYFLTQGYINVRLREDLDKYWMELLEDEWFLQWPLVRWSYATRLFHGQGCRVSKKRAIKILLPLAKEGYPGAMCDVGFCHRFSGGLEINYERSICLWLEASKKGYCEVWEHLYSEYYAGIYKKLSDELRLFFLYEIFIGLLKRKEATLENYAEKFDKKEQEEIRKIFNEGKRLQKHVAEKAFLRSASALFFDNEENPYRIDF